VELVDIMDSWFWRNGKIDRILKVVLDWFGRLVVKKAEDKVVSIADGECSIAWCG
jgi:hypothetical protein